MKIEATQTRPITIDISESEVYRITRETILALAGLQNSVGIYDDLEIVDGKLRRIYLDSYGPYEPDRITQELRKATEFDLHLIKVLEALRES